MRIAAAFLLVAAAAACAAKEEATPDSAAASVAAAPAPTVASFAGTWNTATVLEGTSDTVKATVNLAADGGCTLVLPDRPNIPCTTSMSGDSIVMQTGEFQSILRKGVMTSLRTAGVMTGGMLAGNQVTTYRMPNGEEKVNATFTGTRAP